MIRGLHAVLTYSHHGLGLPPLKRRHHEGPISSGCCCHHTHRQYVAKVGNSGESPLPLGLVKGWLVRSWASVRDCEDCLYSERTKPGIAVLILPETGGIRLVPPTYLNRAYLSWNVFGRDGNSGELELNLVKRNNWMVSTDVIVFSDIFR